MRSIQDIYDISATCKGEDALQAQRTKGVLQAGFNWKEIEAIWD